MHPGFPLGTLWGETTEGKGRTMAKRLWKASWILLLLWGCATPATPPLECQPECDPLVRQRVRVGYNPIGLAVTTDGKWLYAANSGSNSVSKINTETLQVESTIQVNGNPVWVAVGSSQQVVYVTARQGLKLNLINKDGNYLITAIDLPYPPEKVAVDPEEKFAYVTSGFAPFLMVVDLVKQRVQQSIATSDPCLGVAVSPDGKFVYVGTRSQRYNLLIFSTHEQTVVSRTNAGSIPDAIAFGSNGEYAYVANHDSDDVTVIHVPTQHPVLTLPVGLAPMDLAVAPSGQYVYVTCQMDNTVVILDTAQHAVAYRIKLDVTPWGVVFLPDGTRAFVANYLDKWTSQSRMEIAGPQLTMGTGATSRVNNNTVIVLDTQKYR
jgi:YVTN family beta-propeller protein